MIIGALEDVGGRDYLAQQAVENPTAFMSLVGRVLPLQLAGDRDRPLAIDFRWAGDDQQPRSTNGGAQPVIEAAQETVLDVVWQSDESDEQS